MQNEDDPDRPAINRGARIGTAIEGRRGQAPHIRTDEMAAEIRRLARIGMTNSMILDYYSTFEGPTLSETTLKKYYQTDLSMGRVGGVAYAGGKLMEKIKEGNLTAIIFYLKTKGGFIETRGVQVRDKDNIPTDLDIDFTNASKEELNVLAKYFGGILGDDPKIPRAPATKKAVR